MRSRKIKLNLFTESLESGEPLTFARYGDGEVRTILQGPYSGQKNSNGCTFTPYLGQLLKRTLTNNNIYYFGILRVALRAHRAEFSKFLEDNGIVIPWVDGDILLNECLAGNLFPFVDQIRKRKFVMVGPYHLVQLMQEGFFKPAYHLVPPPRNAIQRRANLIRQVKDALKKYDSDLILWSCGLHSKVFISDIHIYTGGRISQIDCGSMWDGFCHQHDGRRVQSRSYIRRGRVDWAALTAVNTGKREKEPGETFRFTEVGDG